MSINERIKLIIDRSGLNQKEAAEWFGFTPGRLSQKLKGEIWDSVQELQQISKHTGYNLDWIVTGEGEEKITDISIDKGTPPVHIPQQSRVSAARVNDEAGEYLGGKKIRVVTVAVDRKDRELMSYVTVRAQAGYMKGHDDPHYIEKLPAFSLPILKDGSYRMFEVDGESMYQIGGGGLHNGDIVIAQYLEDIFTMRDNRVYVVVSKDGVVVKRCLNRLKEKENPVLVCKSDNKNGQHPDIILRPHQIVEVWELKAYISKQLSFATDMWQMLNDVQVQVALMDEKIKRISDERLLPG